MVQTPRPQSTRGGDRTHNHRLREPTRFHCATRARQALSVAQLVEHVTVDVCDHRVAGSIPAAETLSLSEASLAQSVERKALNLVVVGSSPTGGASFCRKTPEYGRIRCRSHPFAAPSSVFRSIEVSIPACHAGDPGSIPGGRDLFHAFQSAQTYPSGYGARLLSECALHAQVRTLPSATSFCQKLGSAGNRTLDLSHPERESCH